MTVAPDTSVADNWHLVKSGTDSYFEALDFLVAEAELLDGGMLNEWLALLSNDIRYRMPVRQTLRRSQGAGFSHAMHFDEDRASLELRVRRLSGSENAWAEDPPSRTRRHVSNVRVAVNEQRLRVKSYVLLYRSRWDETTYELISAERVDELDRVDSQLRLSRRDIYVDQATLGALNLAVFL